MHVRVLSAELITRIGPRTNCLLGFAWILAADNPGNFSGRARTALKRFCPVTSHGQHTCESGPRRRAFGTDKTDGTPWAITFEPSAILAMRIRRPLDLTRQGQIPCKRALTVIL